MNIKRNIALSDTGFVYNPSTGDSFTTNPIGIAIIQMLKESKSQSEIKSHILNSYATDEATFEKDFYDFVNMLQKNKLTDSDEEKKN